MGDSTTISWTDATWNVTRGCRRVSSGCENCYAERQANRFKGPGGAYEGLIKLVGGKPRWTGATKFAIEHLMDPFRWTRPRKIFTDSMSDLFYEGTPTHWVDDIVAVMMICCLHQTRGGHIFQTLTKRPSRMREYFADPETQERVARAAGRLMEDGDGWFDSIAFRPEGLSHPNLWWGTSVENQDAADERIPELLGTPAAVRFLSCEPLLGAVTLPTVHVFGPNPTWTGPRIDWVIAGCESGHGARPCSVEWLRSLRDQCAAAGVAYFLKQAVEPSPFDQPAALLAGIRHFPPTDASPDGSKIKGGGVIELPYLDGVQWAQFPEVSK